MASSSDLDKSFGRAMAKQTSIFDKEAFSRISEVQEAANRAWNSSSRISQGTFGRATLYSTSSTARTAYSNVRTTSVFSKGSSTTSTKSVKRTFTSKTTLTSSNAKSSHSPPADPKIKESVPDAHNDNRKKIELPSSSHGHHIDASNFFKAKFPHDMDSDDFLRSASSRFTMRNLQSTSGWNVEFDEGASLFPDFFPKSDAATKLSFEATWRAVSPTKEFGLAKQAINNWEDEEKKAENSNDNAKEIVNSWMQFFGRAHSVKDG